MLQEDKCSGIHPTRQARRAKLTKRRKSGRSPGRWLCDGEVESLEIDVAGSLSWGPTGGIEGQNGVTVP
jgi:hypothetical protein